MSVRFRWIDVFQRQRIPGHFSAVGITPNSVIIILGQSTKLVDDISTFRIIATRVIARFAEQGEGIEVGPPFTHPPGLRCGNSDVTAHQPVAQPMRVFMTQHFGVEVAIAIGIGTAKDSSNVS